MSMTLIAMVICSHVTYTICFHCGWARQVLGYSCYDSFKIVSKALGQLLNLAPPTWFMLLTPPSLSPSLPTSSPTSAQTAPSTCVKFCGSARVPVFPATCGLQHDCQLARSHHHRLCWPPSWSIVSSPKSGRYCRDLRLLTGRRRCSPRHQSSRRSSYHLSGLFNLCNSLPQHYTSLSDLATSEGKVSQYFMQKLPRVIVHAW